MKSYNKPGFDGEKKSQWSGKYTSKSKTLTDAEKAYGGNSPKVQNPFPVKSEYK